MPFERHAFISYAHIDNQPLPTEKDGWVTLFHEALQQLLAGRLGGNADIWRDHKLQGNDVFSDEIIQQLAKTAVFISVLTPRYLNSEWCAKEVGHFCTAAQETGGVVLDDNKCRVFKVLKLPIERQDALPPVLSQMLGYEFYEFDPDRTPRELDPAYGEKSKQEFLRKVAKLAWDMKLLLERLTAQDSADRTQQKNDAPWKPTVYLAECSRDRRQAREIIEAELKRLGYTVLPDKPLPRDEGDYIAAVETLLGQCQFSIHMIGSNHGLVPDGPSQKSIVVLQNEIAVERSRGSGLQRVIWLREDTASDHPGQAAFIAALHHSADAQFGADLLTGDLETLRGAIHAALTKLERAAQPQPIQPGSGEVKRKRIHVLCEARDRKETLGLLKLLKESADITLPVFTGDAAQVREANQALLLECDAVLLYYGAGDEAWKFHQQNELKRIRALRADRPLPIETLYLADPSSDDKELLVGLGEQNLINAMAGIPEETIAAFLGRIVAGRPTQ
ncbi:MAG: toll/interleukin-1 receptor domain-containing protein [Candidatus Binatia bacterium]